MLTLRGGGGTAEISEQGAEPHSLRGADGHEYLWQAGEQWRRHAPILFPIVGRVPDDTIHVDGRTYPLTQHGFARDLTWEVVQSDESSATLRLRDSDQTRERFPFAFELTAHYAMDDHGLATTYEVSNPPQAGGAPTTGEVDLPVSIGSHPAFAWPLEPGAARTEHVVVFDQPEPAPIRRLDHTLVLPDNQPTPIEGATLRLDPALFEPDAIVMDQVASRGLRYLAPSGRGLRMTWDDVFDVFVVWSRPTGADLLCLEPCVGGAAPIDFTGDLRDKPGTRIVEPGAVLRASYRVDPITP
ncbi:aldose 1-epimerase family protein [Aeromicrobium wangtongii]|uniref:Aldose 1-epimerase family protein n=1 Tax=Aeromicrobium wangtongii TaxID=2969247 RepID=A0ABY5M671_9ACTN|nr:aldose 1-epimerase family protein [Aeromicrobium wangtongii]MCD9199293.1 aldose 1-epimerase family protein [Aeromicrobium wangtongii]UUP13654.1 aldose 1-epimerase family protein [Aeromicrobium wangtongii]